MHRRTLFVVALLVVFSVWSVGLTQKPEEKKSSPPDPQEILVTKLRKVVSFPGLPKNSPTTIGEVLGKLEKEHGVPFKFDVAAFNAEGLSEPQNAPFAERGLPAQDRIELRLLIGLLNSEFSRGIPSGVTYLLRRDHIEITTRQFARAKVSGGLDETSGLPFVQLCLKDRPLREVLRDLSDETEFNMVLDREAAKQGETGITLRMFNVPLDTAVQMVADAADLEVLRRDNLFVLTTAARVDRWQQRWVTPASLGIPGNQPRVGQGFYPPVDQDPD